MVRQVDYGEKIGQGVNATLERLIHEKARKIEEKHDYERNLQFLKGINHPNAEQVAHGSNEQIIQLLKGKPAGTTVNVGMGGNGVSRFDELIANRNGMGQNQPEQQGQEQLAPDQENPPQEVYARPDVQQALRDYMSRPEIQEQYGIENLNKVNAKLEQYAQQAQQQSPTQELMAQGQQEAPEDNYYEQLFAAASNPFELNKAKALRDVGTGGKGGKEVKLTPQNDRFVKKAESDVEFAEEVLPLLDEVEEIVARGKYKHGASEVLKSKIDPSLLTGDTQTLHNTLQNILTIQSNAASRGQGRGSDLLRKMIAEGKLGIGQEPKTLRHRLDAIKKDVLKKKHAASVLAEIEESGKIPVNLADKVRSRVTAEQEKFNRLSDAKKVEYLFNNPKKLTYIRTLEYDGKNYVRDENDNWEAA